MSTFVQRYQWLSGFVEDAAIGVPPTMWGKAPGSATPKDVFKHPFFCSQEDGHVSDNLRLKAFQSVWQTQICLEENKLTEAFTMYLYVSRANIDESDFMEGFYEIIKAYMYLNVSSGALENLSTNNRNATQIMNTTLKMQIMGIKSLKEKALNSFILILPNRKRDF